MIRKIAKSGLKGRKKDSFLLVFVVTLAFIFIVSAIILNSSSETTQYEQRFNMFGRWQASLLNIDSDIHDDIDNLTVDDNISSLGITRFIGRSEQFGNVMTFNNELLDLGDFKLSQGSMPVKKDEIVLEHNQLSYFPKEVKVGNSVDLVMEITLFEIDESEAEEILRDRYLESLDLDGDFYQGYYEKYKEDIDSTIGESKDYLLSLFPDVEDEEILHELMIKEVISWYTYYPSYNKRNEQELEEFDGTKVLTRTSYLYNNDLTADDSESSEGHLELIKKEGAMFSQKIIISRPMIVSGIIESYSNLWDVGDVVIANSFITEEAGNTFLENGFFKTEYEDLVIDIKEYITPANLFIESNMDTDDFIDEYEVIYPGLKRNSYAYPELAGSTEGTLTYGIIAFVFVATVFAVFQIYLTQMRRRSRKLALLKSIGATNGQIIQLIAWEGFYLLLISLFTGMLAGFTLTRGLIFFMNQNKLNNIIFAVDYSLLAFGILIGIFAVVIGMLLPIIMAINIPLTGKITKTPKHKQSLLNIKKKINQDDIYKVKKQNFLNVSIRHIFVNKSKYIITTILYTVAITVLISTIFLSYLFFQDYINQVLVVDKPNYGYEVIYGMPNREIREVVKEIESVEGVISADVYKSGEHAYMWYDRINDQEIYSMFKDMLPTYLTREHFGELSEYSNIKESDKYLIEDALVTNVYGIDMVENESANSPSKQSLFESLNKNLTEGSINKKNFEAGNEVVVLMPMYQIDDGNQVNVISDQNIIENTDFENRMKTFANVTEAFDISYDFRHKDDYNMVSNLKVGDTISLTIPTEDLQGESMSHEVVTHKVKVSGIIHYFSQIGMWPFAKSVENPVIIGSNTLVGKLYPSTIYGPGRLVYETGRSNLENLISSLYPTRFGKTYFYIKTDSELNDLNIFIDLQRIALDREFTFVNYQENINQVFSKAFNFTSIVAVLGLVIAGIALIILYNTTLSKVEQEKDRIGILQSLGVRSKQFNILYLLTGFLSSILALMIAHFILLFIVYLTMDYSLWLYPWKLHIGVCIGFILVATLIYYMPIRKIIKNQPVYNIRSLTR